MNKEPTSETIHSSELIQLVQYAMSSRLTPRHRPVQATLHSSKTAKDRKKKKISRASRKKNRK